jgi:hypothetical protein
VGKRGKNNFKKILDQGGQSTVEFALTLILLLSFMLFYLQLSLVLSFGNYVQYATFMSARAYLSASATREDQRTRARDVIIQMLKKSAGQAGVDKFPVIARGVGGEDPAGFAIERPKEFSPTNRHFSWLEGVRYTFRSKLFFLPLAGSGKAGAQEKGSMGPLNSLTLTSESWLGREPAEDECRGDMGQKAWFFDNGC